MIPYGHQDITKKDIQNVINVLNSDYLTQGPTIPLFEKKLCNYTGAKYSVAVNSCTSALHIACLALDLKPGDILWTSPITFVASANCALYCGATIDLVDIESDTALISVKKLTEKLKQADKDGKLPKIIVPVHFSGQPCDMKEIYVLSQKYGFKIIEDAAHAIGATYQNKLIGNCQYSDITVFSFHPVKLITTGEGGAAMTNSSELSEKMTLLRSHGITRDVNMMQKKIDAPWYYEQIALGFNYRMTDIQAALGISQLNRLDEYVVRRTEISEWYENNLKSKGVTPLIQKSDRNSAHHLFVVKVLGGTIERNKLYLKLRSDDIGVNLHYIPINQQPFFQKELGPGFNKVNVMNADKYFSQALTLPLYPNIKLQQLKYISHKVNGFYGDN